MFLKSFQPSKEISQNSNSTQMKSGANNYDTTTDYVTGINFRIAFSAWYIEIVHVHAFVSWILEFYCSEKDIMGYQGGIQQSHASVENWFKLLTPEKFL